ncbi:MAG TPA: peptidylprolyl isomerase [Bacilli bacterium]|nr:peptidylprolyl isomerase [Bacilli bacterium]
MRKKGYFRQSVLLIMFVAFMLVVTGCGTQPAKEGEGNNQGENLSSKDNPIVTITMENGKEITIELFPEVTPNTVANFISLTKAQFYDGLIFHRVIPGFMIQGGDPTGTGMGGPDYAIKGEFTANGFENNLKHERGVISMARAMDPNSAGSQFFIMVEDSAHLDGEYAAFGKVLTGMEVVDEIVNAERNADDKPLEDQRMKSVVVDTKGKEYSEPEIQ